MIVQRHTRGSVRYDKPQTWNHSGMKARAGQSEWEPSNSFQPNHRMERGRAP